MSYRYYDDYYYNPARERAMMKNMDLVFVYLFHLFFSNCFE